MCGHWHGQQYGVDSGCYWKVKEEASDIAKLRPLLHVWELNKTEEVVCPAVN